MDKLQTLYEENYKKVYYYIKNLCNNDKLAEDLAQETFYKVLLYVHTYKNAAITLAWLIKVAHNLFIDYLRKNKISFYELVNDKSSSPPFASDTEQKVDIANILKMLPARYKSLILLKDYFGFSYGEISEMLNCTQATVKSALRRARNNFREVYETYGK